ncbi:uncharacterized protein LOC144456601 isoform X2 [Phascolarctos cinereus]
MLHAQRTRCRRSAGDGDPPVWPGAPAGRRGRGHLAGGITRAAYGPTQQGAGPCWNGPEWAARPALTLLAKKENDHSPSDRSGPHCPAVFQWKGKLDPFSFCRQGSFLPSHYQKAPVLCPVLLDIVWGITVVMKESVSMVITRC